MWKSPMEDSCGSFLWKTPVVVSHGRLMSKSPVEDSCARKYNFHECQDNISYYLFTKSPTEDFHILYKLTFFTYLVL